MYNEIVKNNIKNSINNKGIIAYNYNHVIVNINYSIDDIVINGYINSNGDIVEIQENIINYNNNGQPYFIRDNIEYYIDEFMRV